MSIRNRLSWAIAAMLAAVGTAPAAPGNSWWNARRSAPVCIEAHDQEHPAISATEQEVIVVWQDSRPDGKKAGTKFPLSVRGMALEQRREFVVYSPPDSNAVAPAISGAHAVMSHNRGWSNAILISLPPGAPTTLGSVAFGPAIDGRLVAFSSAVHRWEGWTGPGAPSTNWIADIIAYEMNSIGLPFDVATSDMQNQNNPAVSGTTIVWQQSNRAGGWSNWGIYKRDINVDPDPVRVCKNPGKSAQRPAVSGAVIVWQDNRNGNWDIYGYDLATHREMEICRAPGDQEAPAIDGPTVVWQDNRGGDWDIFGCDLNAGRVLAVYQGKGDQTEPDICADLVVWTDSRRGNKDICINRRQRE